MAYGLLRMAFGVNLAGHGLVRIYHGTGQFAGATASHLAGAPLPHGLVYGFGLAIPWAEALLGIALILGLLTRVALVGGAVFMMALTVGVTANQQWDVAGQQLVYSVVFFLLLFLVEHNGLALDGMLAGRRAFEAGIAPSGTPVRYNGGDGRPRGREAGSWETGSRTDGLGRCARGLGED